MIKLTALSTSELVEILRKSGSQYVDENLIREDIRNGAPTNPDGTINLVFYAAWLVKGMSRGAD